MRRMLALTTSAILVAVLAVCCSCILPTSAEEQQITVPKKCHEPMNSYCNKPDSCPPVGGTLYALFSHREPWKRRLEEWRCFAEGGLDETKSYYLAKGGYCTRNEELASIAYQCMWNVPQPISSAGRLVDRPYTGTYVAETVEPGCMNVCETQPDFCLCQCLLEYRIGPVVIDDYNDTVINFQGPELDDCDCPAAVGYELGERLFFSVNPLLHLTVDLSGVANQTYNGYVFVQTEKYVQCWAKAQKVSDSFDAVPATTTDVPETTQAHHTDTTVSMSIHRDDSFTSATPTTTNDAKTDAEPSVIVPGAAAGGGLLLVLIICSIFLVKACRRRTGRKTSPEAMLLETYGASDGMQTDAGDLLVKRTDLLMGAVIGSGAFGEVREGKYNGQTVAIKSLHEGASEDDVEDFKAEALLLRDLYFIGEHPNVIRLIGFDFSTEPWLIVMEYMSMGNLLSLLQRADPRKANHPIKMPLTRMIDVCRQCASGLAFLEKHKYLHRDIAARNVLVGQGFVCKLADFGLARDVYNSHIYVKTSRTRVPYKWMAESIHKSTYTGASDVWSFGVLMWEVFSYGSMPYPTVDNVDVLEYLLEGNRLERPDMCPEELYAVMLRCWSQSPRDRPTFQQLALKLSASIHPEPRTAQTSSQSQGPHAYADLLSEEEQQRLVADKAHLDQEGHGDDGMKGDDRQLSTSAVAWENAVGEMGNQAAYRPFLSYDPHLSEGPSDSNVLQAHEDASNEGYITVFSTEGDDDHRLAQSML